MVSRCPGENAFLGSHKVGNFAQLRFSSCEGFLLPPHPQVGTPVSRKRFARSYAGLLILGSPFLMRMTSPCSKSFMGPVVPSHRLASSANLRNNQFMVQSDLFPGKSADILVFYRSATPSGPVVRWVFTFCAFPLSSSPATHAEMACDPRNA